MADAAQYAIEIAAKLAGGDQTAAALDSMAANLEAAGRDASFFEDAWTRLGGQMAKASTKTRDANEALSKGQAEFKQLERAADRAAKALERQQLKGVVKPETIAQARAARQAVSAFAVKLDVLRDNANQAAAAEERLAKQSQALAKVQKRVNDRLGDAASKVSTFRGALGDIGGPIGQLGERLLFPVQAFVDLNEWFGKSAATATLLVVGYTAVAAAIAAVVVAAAVAVAGVTASALALADSARSAGLAHEALAVVHPEIVAMSRQIDALAGSTKLARGDLDQLAISLKAAKVPAADMPAALRAVALAESALGQGQGLALFTEKVKKGRQSVAEFAMAAEQDFGGIVARQMLSLEVQGERLKSNITGLFSGLQIEDALQGVKRIVDMFDKGSEVGRTIKFLFETIFQPLINQAQLAAYVVDAFFLGMAIGALRVYLAVKPVVDKALEMLGLDFSGWTLEDVLAGVARVGELLVPVMLGVGAAIVAVGAALLAGPIVIGTAAAAVGMALYYTFKQVAFAVWDMAVKAQASAQLLWAVMSVAVSGVTELLSSLVGAALELGSNIMNGLAQGIMAGAGAVVSAMSGAVNGAINAAKRQLGIASPSRVFAEIGSNTGKGFAEGIEGEQGRADDALANMVAPPDTAAMVGGGRGASASTGGAGGGSSRASVVVNLEGATFTFQGVSGVEGATAALREGITEVFEGLGLQLAGAAT